MRECLSLHSWVLRQITSCFLFILLHKPELCSFMCDDYSCNLFHLIMLTINCKHNKKVKVYNLHIWIKSSSISFWLMHSINASMPLIFKLGKKNWASVMQWLTGLLYIFNWNKIPKYPYRKLTYLRNKT